jgi:murein DD-endopeptidase MepM/ murein hydrolase activator NlpD
VNRLVIAGKPQGSPTRRKTYGLQGYGKLVALDTPAQAIVGLTVKLSKRYGRYPRGAVLRVAYASASASDGIAPPPPKPKPKPNPKPSAKPTPKPKPKPAARRKPSRTHVLLTAKGFVFPVYGKHDYTDTFGAPRADTGFHQGNDIFAAAGTPLVAVCDGSLNRVGTLPISGNRLWVKCAKTGDSFFYAHLSAFATNTRDGLHVKAGQVIGFLGSTGDAEQTPPHLHFEVHPGSRAAVDPYPFLRAWENRRDVPAAAWVRANGETGQQPGTLVVMKDFLSP